MKIGERGSGRHLDGIRTAFEWILISLPRVPQLLNIKAASHLVFWLADPGDYFTPSLCVMLDLRRYRKAMELNCDCSNAILCFASSFPLFPALSCSPSSFPASWSL